MKFYTIWGPFSNLRFNFLAPVKGKNVKFLLERSLTTEQQKNFSQINETVNIRVIWAFYCKRSAKKIGLFREIFN